LRDFRNGMSTPKGDMNFKINDAATNGLNLKSKVNQGLNYGFGSTFGGSSSSFATPSKRL
jgi:hypothetical protein